MNLPLSWNDSFTAALVNHLWQSTVVAALAFLLALALRKNHARVRYWVWFAASVKFLLPFSLLIAAGEWMRSLFAAPVLNRPEVAAAMVQIAQPFSGTEVGEGAAAPMAAHASHWLPLALLAIWMCGALVVAARFARSWWRANAASRAATPLALAAEVPVLSTSAPMEPGIFGIFRPVLLLPEGILERLSAGQLRAIVAHEMCHVRRRDNLTFFVHQMSVALFWFHPAVWWIGKRLIEERERACDEAVVLESGAAETYAEGILNVCRFYLESPAACVAGVTGADLKERIVRIMTGKVARNLSAGRKLLLASIAAIAVVVPVLSGMAWARQQPAQQQTATDTSKPLQFEVVSIKAHKDEGMRMMIGTRFLPDGFTAEGWPLDDFLRQAFSLPQDRILNQPEWTKSSRYDIQAKVAPEDAPRMKGLSSEQRWSMLIPVLQDRFGLKFHHETREMEVYSLEVAKGGPKLKETTPEELAAMDPPPDRDKPGVMGGPRKGKTMMQASPQGITLKATASTLAGLTRMLSQQTGSTVVDKTGLIGSYDFTLSFTPDQGVGMMILPKGPAPQDGGGESQEPVGPSLFTALQEQLGLKLVAQKQKVDVVVIDHIEQPSAN
ncbi:MAG TPA: M56 family metallopeptidase [Terracidiphilus sp.]|nr:M56 family metallopeptidase [Terracidiphilus sp.]